MGDLLLNANGDLLLDATGDLQTIEGQAAMLQQVQLRLRSMAPDLYRSGPQAAGLGELRGQPNSRETAEEGVRRITQALTSDGLVPAAGLIVRSHPTAENQLTWFVFVHLGGTDSEGFTIDLDFNRGVIVRGVRE